MKVLEIVSTMGPGRRAAVKVVEMVLLADTEEQERFGHIADVLQRRLPSRLAELGLVATPAAWQQQPQDKSAIERIADQVCRIALELQNAAGHVLQFHDFLQDQAPGSDTWRYRFIFQHDDIPSGEQAGDLAMRIASEACPALQWEALLHDPAQPLAYSIAEFITGSRPYVTPPETLALVAAAQARDIPVLRLEREPYGKLPASFRVAPNGMVMLGHSRHRVMMDGLFCINRPGPGYSIMNDRRAMWQMLLKLGVQPPASDPALMLVNSPATARHNARQLGYPLSLRPLQRQPAATAGWLLQDEAQLDHRLALPGMAGAACLLEPERAGARLEILLVAGRLLAALRDGQEVAVGEQLSRQAQAIGQAMNCGVLLVSCQLDEPAGSDKTALRVVDLDPSPRLETLLQAYPRLRQQAYEGLLDWLYPPGQPCRIPIISITGTNGKTTTSTMIARMARTEGLFAGMARTTGVYFDQELRELGDSAGFLGHCMVFEHPEVDLAVLETARGDVLRSGFAFDHSDVAICTNVTADHLGEHGVETVADMAVVKCLVLERSTGCVVLNADDVLCREMLPRLAGRKLFVSSFLPDPGAIRELLPAAQADSAGIIHVQQHEQEEWIVLRDGAAVIPVIRVNGIPATIEGAARHNISNAMHAIAGAYALGLELESIRSALAGFEMGYDSLPGRLNMHFNGRYHIIMDYAHNADGLKQLVRFTDQFPCQGRRILRFGVSPNASRAACLGAATTVAGHFDHYICSAKPGHDPADGLDTAQELRLGLLQNGVDAEQVEVFTDIERSVEHPASLCQPGDLLVLVTSNAGLAGTWEKILKT